MTLYWWDMEMRVAVGAEGIVKRQKPIQILASSLGIPQLSQWLKQLI